MVNFENIVKNIKNITKRELVLLWIFSLLVGLALVALQNKNKFPLGKGDFVFLAIIALCVALYRPRWIFFLFVSFVPLENIILASGFLPIQLRPYQFLGAVLILAVAILYIFKKLKFKFLKPTWIDWFLFSLVPFSFLALLNSPNKSITLKQSLILFSFIALYYLARNFIRIKNDLVKTAFFFTGSFLIFATYGFYQVFADKFNARSFEVMFGRPNSTFAEPDWLGIFLCFALAVFLTLIIHFTNSREKTFFPKKYILTILDILALLDIILIILTLSRSAWIGTAVIIILYLLYNLYKKERGGIILTLQKFARELVIISLILLASLAAIRFGKLSKFDIFDRIRSTATSEQKITIACENNLNIPRIVSSADELAKYNCRHINLEEINYYKSQGKIVTEIYRKDPNVMTRSAIYRESWNIIKAHPILGVGFGTITQNLGTDQRGAGLNESNIFLQVWAGSGILGLIAFAAVIGYLFMHSFRKLSPVCPPRHSFSEASPLERWLDCPVVKDEFEKTLAVFSVLGISALIIPNLFNAGLLMALLWFGLAITVGINELEK